MSNCRNKRGQFARCQVGKAPSRGRRASRKVQLDDASTASRSGTTATLEDTKGIIRIAIPNPNGYEGQVLVEVYEGIPRVHIWDGSTDAWNDDPAHSIKLNRRS